MKYTENDHKYALRKSNKVRGINILGGKCMQCGEEDVAVLEFHHPKKNKEEAISQILDRRWSNLELEIKKCKILCSNCHAEEHCQSSGKRNLIKNIMLQKLNVFKCCNCGYVGKNFSSLDFHHIDKNEKSFGISRNAKEINVERLLEESKKCKIICKKCHKKEHFDYRRFNLLKELIFYKVNNHKEKPKEYDKNVIWSLYGSGKKQCEIVKIIGCKSGTLSYIIKNLKKKYGEKNDRHLRTIRKRKKQRRNS